MGKKSLQKKGHSSIWWELMDNLPALTPKAVMKILEKHGFILDRIKGSHYIYYQPKTKRIVVVPMHKGSLPKGTLLEILKQSGIERDNFK